MKIKRIKNFSNTAQKKLRMKEDIKTGKAALGEGSNTTFIFESEIGGPEASIKKAGREFNRDVFKRPGEKGKTILIKENSPEVLGRGLKLHDKINARSIANGEPFMTSGFNSGKIGHRTYIIARKIKK